MPVAVAASVFMTKSMHGPGTPTKATSVPGDYTMNQPYDLTPGTSTEIILNHQSASANMADSCAMAPVASTHLLENLLPHQTCNQAHPGITLCLPAPRSRAKPKNSRPTLERKKRANTFWTFCPSCRMMYEYVNIFLDQELLCHECEIPFMATKMPAPDPVEPSSEVSL